MPAGRDVLLDTGPLVAVLDARDPWHARCVEVWPQLINRCVTTEAIVTEASHFVLRGGAAASAPLSFLMRAGIPVLGLPADGMRRAATLMDRFADLPMDYADATLVVLSEALHIETAFTTDRRGFMTYRRARGKRFVLLPD